MQFEEAIDLARQIRQREGWYLLEIEVASGEKLEDDRWQVSAVSTLHWGYIHYWNRPGMATEWPRYAETAEQGMRERASSHEQ